MPIVFVHGVSIRKEHDYYAPTESARNNLFTTAGLKGILPDAELKLISNPYWGGDGAKFAWGLGSLPTKKAQTFGTTASERLDDLAEQVSLRYSDVPLSGTDILLQIARISLPEAIDILWTGDVFAAEELQLPELAAFGVLASDYAEVENTPEWLWEIDNDAAFVELLVQKVGEAQGTPAAGASQTFGILSFVDRLKTSAFSLGKSVVAKGTRPIIQRLRPGLNEFVARFVGDVFVYLRTRDSAGDQSAIIKTVVDAIRTAAQRRSDTNKLVIVGHSMGGNIVYDLLTSSLTDVTCDAFLTVGSQVGLFEEMKLYRGSKPEISAPNKVPMPGNIKAWLNVYDRADIFSYCLEPIVNGVQDFEYDSGSTALEAHGAYLMQPRFHRRLNKRLKELLKIK